jgi:hypothetical protein
MTKLQEILNIIKNTPKYVDYVEYNLHKSINIDNVKIKGIINEINKNPNTECYYNKKTRICGIIGVVDINKIRIIDFDDNIYTLTNKGINQQTKDFIH